MFEKTKRTRPHTLLTPAPPGSFGPVVTPQTGMAPGFVGVKWSDWVNQSNRLQIDCEFEIPTGHSVKQAKIAVIFELRDIALAPSVTILVSPSIFASSGRYPVLMSCRPKAAVGESAWTKLWRSRQTFSTGFIEAQADLAVNSTTQFVIGPADGSEKIVQLLQQTGQIEFSIWHEGEPVLRLPWINDADFPSYYEKLVQDAISAKEGSQ